MNVSEMVKEKPDQVRTYDGDGYRRRAACICVRDHREEEVLLVSSSGKPHQWVVPGGGVEPNEDTELAASREVEEEAGVKGCLGRCLGQFTNEDRRHKTTVYVMKVVEELPNWDDSSKMGRKRRWFSLSEAFSILEQHKPIQKQYLTSLTTTTSGCNSHQGCTTHPNPDTTPPPGCTTHPNPDTTPSPGCTTHPNPDTTPPPGCTTHPNPDTTPPPGCTTHPNPDTTPPPSCTTHHNPDTTPPPGCTTHPNPDTTPPPPPVLATPPEPSPSSPFQSLVGQGHSNSVLGANCKDG